jgi:hypothetical protein
MAVLERATHAGPATGAKIPCWEAGPGQGLIQRQPRWAHAICVPKAEQRARSDGASRAWNWLYCLGLRITICSPVRAAARHCKAWSALLTGRGPSQNYALCVLCAP